MSGRRTHWTQWLKSSLKGILAAAKREMIGGIVYFGLSMSQFEGPDNGGYRGRRKTGRHQCTILMVVFEECIIPSSPRPGIWLTHHTESHGSANLVRQDGARSILPRSPKARVAASWMPRNDIEMVSGSGCEAIVLNDVVCSKQGQAHTITKVASPVGPRQLILSDSQFSVTVIFVTTTTTSTILKISA